MQKRLITGFGAIAAMGAAQAFAADTIGYDGFDGVGDIYTTRTITPDNTAANGHYNSIFDVFGIVDPTGTVAYDFLDDSANGFEFDDLGIFKVGDRDKFFATQDNNNGNNPSGQGTATWTFDISGYENLNLSVDLAAVGDFEADDEYFFFGQIDGGPLQQLMYGAGNSGTFYEVTMEGGTTYDRFGSAFFDETEWIDATTGTSTSGATVAYHSLDNGQDGDTTANDGYIPIETINGVDTVRAYNVTNGSGNFDEVEFEAFKDPIQWVTADDPVGVQLDNDIQTITTGVSGIGSTLTLSFFTVNNSAPELFAFDDVTLTGDLIASEVLAGDYDDNGLVGSGDLGLVLTFWGALVADGEAPDSSWINSDSVVGPNIGSDELALVLSNWGNTAAISAALAEITAVTGLSEAQVYSMVPEPATMALLLLSVPMTVIYRGRRA